MFKHYPYDALENGIVTSSKQRAGLIADSPEFYDSLDMYSELDDMPVPRSCIDRRSKMNNQNSNKPMSTDKFSNKKDSNQNSNQSSNKKESNQNSNKKD